MLLMLASSPCKLKGHASMLSTKLATPCQMQLLNPVTSNLKQAFFPGPSLGGTQVRIVKV